MLLLFGAAAVAFQEDIVRTWLDPKQPFQTYRPPRAPDYARPSAWALLPRTPDMWTGADPPADVFFVHPTTFVGGADWNGAVGERRAEAFLQRVVLPNYAGPFQRVGRVFAPRYRQASLYAFMTNREDAQDARRFAYGDVLAAFRAFLGHAGGRPFLIVGVEQGGSLAARLVRDVVAPDPSLRARLVEAVLAETIVPAEAFAPGGPVPACDRADEAGCVLAWRSARDDAEADKLARRALVWTGDGRLEDLGARPPLCVNPLLGRTGTEAAPARLDLGSTNATGLEWGVRPAFLPRAVSARCEAGFLRASPPSAPSLRRAGDWIDRLRAAPFNLFYANEEADAERRLAALTARPGWRAPAPTAGSVEIRHAPVHRAD